MVVEQEDPDHLLRVRVVRHLSPSGALVLGADHQQRRVPGQLHKHMPRIATEHPALDDRSVVLLPFQQRVERLGVSTATCASSGRPAFGSSCGPVRCSCFSSSSGRCHAQGAHDDLTFPGTMDHG
jgi:hypothetical protein